MRFYQPTKAQKAAYKAWVKKLPKKSRDLAARFDPWTLYRLTSSGDRVFVRSFADDGTLTVRVSGEFNRVLFARDVFRVPADHLVECDLPGPNEVLGVELTPAQAHDRMEELKVLVRPDLWMLDPELGKAVRKQ